MTLTTLPLSSSGLTLGLRDHGAGEPVLLIHGVGMQSAAWAPQIETLSTRHRLIAVDMPGHGASDQLPSGSALPAFVEWLHDVVETLNLGRINLVGHSMGALIVGGFTVSHPDRVQRAALLNGVFRRSAVARSAVEQRAAEIRAGHTDHDAPLRRWFGDTVQDQHARAQVAGWLSQVSQPGYATAYTAFAQGDATYADRFSQITCPFLALTADGDPNSLPAMSEEMANSVQDGQAIILQGHRHMANLTAPELVSRHLGEWLGRMPNPRSTQ